MLFLNRNDDSRLSQFREYHHLANIADVFLRILVSLNRYDAALLTPYDNVWDV